MSFLYDNVCTLAIAALGCMFAWLYGGTIASALMPAIPWLTVFLFEIMLCFPQRLRGETTYAARARVWTEVRRDPLTWTALAFLLLLSVPFVNTGLCPICDYAKIHIENMDPSPTIPFLPYCVNRMQHLNVFLWFAPALTAMLATKHALAKHGKRMLLSMFVWNGMFLSLLGVIQQVTGAEAPLWAKLPGRTAYFFSTFGYPNMGGDYFTTLFAISVALWRWNYQEATSKHAKEKSRRVSKHSHFWRKYFMLVPALVFFFSALATLCRASIILVSLMLLVFFAHSLVSMMRHVSQAKRFKTIVISVSAMLGLVACSFLFMPESLQREIDTLDTTAVLDRVTGRGQYHVRVAGEVWKDNFLFGCGGWGYRHFCIPKMTADELKQQQKIGGINVHNDYLQFLAEHGAVGFGLLFAIVFMLLKDVCRKWRVLVYDTRFVSRKQLPPKPVVLFVLPAGAFCILVSVVATLVHAFGDCPLRSPAVLTLFFVSLAAIDGFMPYVDEPDK